MVWQSIVLSAQILLLAVGWILFQQARSELSARAAETPVLSEVKALHRNVKQLLSQIEATAEDTGARLEQSCQEARTLIAALENHARALSAPPLPARRTEAYRPRGRGRVARAEWIGSQPPPPNPIFANTALENLSPATTECAVEEKPCSMVNETREGSPHRSLSTTGSRRQIVYNLADAGESTAAIAAVTQLSEGEVETLLGLRQQRRTA